LYQITRSTNTKKKVGNRFIRFMFFAVKQPATKGALSEFRGPYYNFPASDALRASQK